MSELALRLIEENKRTQDPFLDLGNCGLVNELPEELPTLGWLEGLNLGRGYYSYEAEKWVNSKNNGEQNIFHGSELAELAPLTSLQALYLHSSKVQHINFVAQLSQLHTLDLGYNEITDSSFLENLIKLRYLDLNSNRIQDIRFLRNLDELQYLGLGANKIEDGSFLETLSQLRSLDLSANLIQNIGFLQNLIHLQYLDLSHNEIQDYSSLRNLTRLNRLSLRSNKIEDISPIQNLSSLKRLDLSGNQIQDISFLENLSELHTLNLSGNQIQTISSFENLTHLNHLYLGSTQINDYSFLLDFTRLESLDLKSNSLTDIGFLQNLHQLYRLDLSKNHIQDISSLENLSQLSELNLCKNKIQNISTIARLSLLRSLDLDTNHIDDITCLKNLNHLQFLDLSYNLIQDIKSLSNLTGLLELYLNKNPIAEIKTLHSLNRLNVLQIDGKKYTSLGIIKELIESNKIPVSSKSEFYKPKSAGEFVTLKGNPIFPPLPIIQKGENAIVSYFDSLKRGAKPLNEVKVLLVGDGAAGKTSLVKSLTSKVFNAAEKQTHGIQIQNHTITIDEETVQVHYWDFGGQEIMHATHQFFLTKDCVYLLVLDGRRDENPEYWLKHIATFGGNAPVLVVMNKDEDNRAYDVVKQDLSKKFPNIKGYFRLSCKTKAGIEAFTVALQKEIRDLDFRKTPFSIYWDQVKDHLRKMEKPHINYSEYYNLCAAWGVFNKEEQDTLLGYLNSLGIILHFEELKQYDTQVLNPLWLTQAVYRVINSQKIAQKGGQYHEDDLSDILNDELYANKEPEGDQSLVQKLLKWFSGGSSRKKHKLSYEDPSTLPFIAKVMQQFELSYNIAGTKSYIIPDLLPIEPARHIDYKDYPLHFATDFYFLPPALLPRFIVQTNFNVVDAIKWRTGAVLNAEGVFNAEAVVRIDKENKRLHVHARGEQKREILTYIRGILQGLYASYDGLQQAGRVTELLFLPDNPDIAVLYDEIEGLEAIGEEYYSSGIARKRYKLSELFGEIESPDYKLTYVKEKPVRIFISYSRKKKRFRDEFVTKLFPLIGLKENYLEAWHDEHITPGTDWTKGIDEAINNADIVVCLLSDEYLASDYCMYEFNKANETKDQKKIYPILINHCAWEDTGFKNIQGYFTALEPVPAARRPQKWQEVYVKIKAIIEKLKPQ